MPTNKIRLNGEEVELINKKKLPLDVDWQDIVRKKQKETADEVAKEGND